MTTASTMLDLDAGVTREQYHDALKSIWASADVIARRHDWCTGYIDVLHRRICTDFPYVREDRYGELQRDAEIDVPPVRTPAEYAALLRQIRGRILYYVREGTLYLEEANRALDDAGVGGYHTRDKQYRVTIPQFRVEAGNLTLPTVQRRVREALRGLEVKGITLTLIVDTVRVDQFRSNDVVPACDVIQPAAY